LADAQLTLCSAVHVSLLELGGGKGSRPSQASREAAKVSGSLIAIHLLPTGDICVSKHAAGAADARCD